MEEVLLYPINDIQIAGVSYVAH